MINSAGHHFGREFILLNFCWNSVYRFIDRDLVEIALDRGVSIAHSAIIRWNKKFSIAIKKSTRK